jgi:predicted ATPase
MRKFVITCAPGVGKTAILRPLELEGFRVVEEAATDVIAVAEARGTDQPTWSSNWFRSSQRIWWNA